MTTPGTVQHVAVAPHRRVAVHLSPGDAPILLMGHGVGSSADFLRLTLEEPLVEAGWRLAAMDLRGHGNSDPAPDAADHLIATHAADLSIVAGRLGAKVVGGLSIASMATVRAATDGLAVDGVLAIIPGWSGPSTPGHGPHAMIAAEVRAVGISGMLARLEADRSMPDWVRAQVLGDYRRQDPDSLEAALLSLDGEVGPTLADVAGLGCPIAVVGWHDDPGHPLEVAADWAATARRGSFASTTLDAMAVDQRELGRAAVRALEAAGITPDA